MQLTRFRLAGFILVGVTGVLLMLTFVGVVLGIPMFLYAAKRISDLVTEY